MELYAKRERMKEEVLATLFDTMNSQVVYKKGCIIKSFIVKSNVN